MIIGHVGKYTYLLSDEVLDEKINAALMWVIIKLESAANKLSVALVW